ncbi:bpX6 domain-containing protein, partial [Lentzea kentuckyensis]|uniref:bpX6 domain-containing protein n=1 Tax=Lentzea kentuckyensis TaxID=360086 RepID=UPI000A3A2BEF
MTTFRGTVTAKAFVIDVGVIGETEARTRVLDLWQPGARIYVTPTGSWLVALAEPVEVRAERAPGLPLTEIPDGLQPLDCAQWTDTSGLTRYELTPADDEPAPALVESTVPETPELRFRGGIGAPSQHVGRLTGGDARQAVGTATVVVGAVSVFTVVPLVLFALAPDHGKPMLLIAFLVGFAFLGKAFAGTEGAATAAPTEPGNFWVRLVMRTPLRGLVRSKHERYLRRLTELFERKDWHNALRDAIGIGQDGEGRLSLRVPQRRTGELRPNTALGPGAGPYYGPQVQQHLQSLYRTAAEELERLGRHDEAAFVHADLLGDPAAAAAMYERLGRWTDAAELAEGRRLAADLVVRLWLRAGNKERAIDVARARGAFAAVIARLPVEEGRELRAEWVRDRQAAGDHLGAVAAAWPDDATRPLAMDSIQAGMALGGPASSTLFAHLVVGWPSPSTHAGALALLDNDDPRLARSRAHFVDAWLGLSGGDRELGSAAIRAFVRDGTVVPPALKKAADPLLAADLPKAPKPRRDVVDLVFPAMPAQLVVRDAVALRGGAVLVALGDQGTRLVTEDGRTRARWDVPAHQIVISDHGGSALLVGRRGAICEVHHLDLASRKVRHWTTLAHRTFVGSFDGGIAIVVGPDGLEFLDVRRSRPTVVWRELDRHAKVFSIARNEHSLAVLFEKPDDDQLDLWRWDLPDLTLRRRGLWISRDVPGRR